MEDTLYVQNVYIVKSKVQWIEGKRTRKNQPSPDERSYITIPVRKWDTKSSEEFVQGSHFAKQVSDILPPLSRAVYMKASWKQENSYIFTVLQALFRIVRRKLFGKIQRLAKKCDFSRENQSKSEQFRSHSPYLVCIYEGKSKFPGKITIFIDRTQKHTNQHPTAAPFFAGFTRNFQLEISVEISFLTAERKRLLQVSFTSSSD